MSSSIDNSHISGQNVNIDGIQNVITTNITNAAPLIQTCPMPPPEPERFGGRTIALAKLCDSLEKGEFSVLTAVHGLGGIGKTTLATKAANDLFKQKVFRAVLYATVGRNPNPIAIFEKWARDVGATLVHPADATPKQLASSLKNLLDTVINTTCEQCEPPRILVFLDDVWDDVDGLGQKAIKLIRQACPAASTLLLTTRFEGLAIELGANRQSLDRLTPEEGAELLQTFEDLAPLNAKELQALSQALDGHALALELAAKRIGKSTNKSKALHDHTAEYETKIPLGVQFKELKLEKDEKQENGLTVVLSRSYAELTPDDQVRFRQLGVLPPDAPFNLPMLAAIWSVEQDKVEEHRDTLRLASLLESARASGDDWYRQHRLLRSYALALLKTVGEAENTFARYADHINQITELFWSLPPEQWSVLTPYLSHIHTVGAALVTQTDSLPSDPDDILLKRAQLFAVNISNYLANRREIHQIEWLEMGFQTSAKLKDESRQAFFLNNLGVITSASGNKKQALQYYKQALILQHKVGDISGVAIALSNLAQIFGDLGEKRQALQYFEKALPLHHEIGDINAEAKTLTNMGRAYADLGEKRQALQYFEKALPLHRKVGNKSSEATTLNNLGLVYLAFGNKQEALNYFEQALNLHREVSNMSGEATTLNNFGRVYLELGNKQEALNYFEQALNLHHIANDKEGQVTVFNNFAAFYFEAGYYENAKVYYEQALFLSHEIGDKKNEGTVLHNLGFLYANLGEQQKALNYYEQALDLRRASGDKGGEASTLNNLGSLYVEFGNQTKALNYYEQALPLYKLVEDKEGEASCLNNMGTIYAASTNLIKALEFYEQALILCKDVGDQDGEVTALNNIADLQFRQGRYDQAASTFRRLIQLIQAINIPAREATLHANLAATLEKMKRIPEAIAELNQTISILKRFKLPQDASGTSLQRYEEVFARLHQPQPDPILRISDELVGIFMDNTIAAKTDVSDKLVQWHDQLQDIRARFVSSGPNWQNEIAFADALLAILEDQPIILHDSNPYYLVVQKGIAAITDYRKGT